MTSSPADPIEVKGHVAVHPRLDLTAIVESSFDGIISIDFGGRIVSCNLAAAELYGYSNGEELVGQRFDEVASGALADQWQDLWERIRSDDVVHRVDSSIERRDGPTVDVAVVVSPVRDVSGAVLGISFVLRDVSEQRRLEQEVASKQAELARVNAELKTSNDELERFAYVASHDLQEPLRMVSSYVQLLQRRYEGQLDQDADDFIHYAVDGANRMKRLINDLLSLSRLMKSELQLVTCDLGEIVSETVLDMAAVLEEEHVTVDVGPLPTVQGDPTQLRRVWQNLFANAIKFRSAANPVVEVRSRRRAGDWIMSVADNGIGIPERDRTQIFDLFTRLHPHGAHSGSGLGLAIVKNVVARHGGEVWAESSASGGSTFFFTLPAMTKGT